MKTKRIVIQFCVTAKEKRAIQRRASFASITVSQWLRTVARCECAKPPAWAVKRRVA